MIELSYREFAEFKNKYLSDPYPLWNFGTAFCMAFNIDNADIRFAPTLEVCLARIEALIVWVI